MHDVGQRVSLSLRPGLPIQAQVAYSKDPSWPWFGAGLIAAGALGGALTYYGVSSGAFFGSPPAGGGGGAAYLSQTGSNFLGAIVITVALAALSAGSILLGASTLFSGPAPRPTLTLLVDPPASPATPSQ
jgi:hypothetical protein